MSETFTIFTILKCLQANLDNVTKYSGFFLKASLNSDIAETSCLTFSNGEWSYSHSLQHRRSAHNSFVSNGLVMLIGGSGSSTETETEILTTITRRRRSEGSSRLNFDLKYPSS